MPTVKVKLEFDGKQGWYYSIRDTCEVLEKSRSTIMRLLPSWEEVTGYPPKKDNSGRWFIPTRSVTALLKDTELYLKLSKKATKWKKNHEGLKDRIAALEDENKQLKMYIHEMKGNL